MNMTGIRVEAVAEAGSDMTELLTETAEGDRRQPAGSAPATSPGGMAARKRLRVTGIGFDLGKTIMGCRRPRFVAPQRVCRAIARRPGIDCADAPGPSAMTAGAVAVGHPGPHPAGVDGVWPAGARGRPARSGRRAGPRPA